MEAIFLEYIKSSKNSFFKEIRGLKVRKNREEANAFVVEGLRFVEEAIAAGVEIKSLIMTEGFYNRVAGRGNDDIISTGNVVLDYIERAKELEKDKGGAVLFGEDIFHEICDTDNPQGILAVVEMPYKNGLESVCDDIKNGSFIVILDTVQDPGNMGTVIRTGDAFGADLIILSEGSVDAYNPKTLRATMGSVFHVPVVKGGETVDIIRLLQSEGYKIFASHLKGTMNVYDADFSGKIAVIIGNEGRGISDEVRDASDHLVKIPMPGKAESLNASIAAGILLYEVIRKKNI